MKKRAGTESTPLPTIYRDTMVEMSLDSSASTAVANVPTLYTLQPSLYCSRRKRLPPMPATIDDVSLTGDWARSLKGEPFLLGTADNIHVLAIESNVEILAEADEFFLDGTFKIAWCLFHQVFTVDAFKHGKQLRLLIASFQIRPRKPMWKCLKILTEGIEDLSLQPNVQRVTTDFKIAIIQAAQEVFPSVSAKGCFYHYT